MSSGDSMQQRADEFRDRYQQLREQVGRVIVGHEEIVHGVLTCLFVGGHCLLEGVPGLGKTLLVRTLAQALSLDFNRIQFTPDLMPADILGTNMVMETPDGKRVFEFQRGPLFTQICLADEINRATPKTQSAMLETMQEGTITIGGTRYELDKPFFVMATQNPIEQEGTYPLPEAQVDRFMLKVKIDYPTPEEERRVLDMALDGNSAHVHPVLSGDDITAMQDVVTRIYIDDQVKDYIVSLVQATRQPTLFGMKDLAPLIDYGGSPRATIFLGLGARANAFLNGRGYVTPQDVKDVAYDVLRHRVVLTYEAEAEEVSSEDVIATLLSTVPVP